MKTYKVKKYDNRTEWRLNGKLHREDGPAIEWADGFKSWFLDGKLHREDGPAIVHPDGSKEWWVNGKRHREDGPAVEWYDGGRDWFLNGQRLSRDKFNEWKNSQVTQVTPKELTINQIESLLGYKIKVIGE